MPTQKKEDTILNEKAESKYRTGILNTLQKMPCTKEKT